MLSEEFIEQLEDLRTEDIPAFVAALGAAPEQAQAGMLAQLYDWRVLARPDQLEPEGVWRTWVVNGGRGSGKTRTGSETVQENVVTGRARRIALVSQSASDVRDVMIEGPSGILSVAPPWARPTYYPSKRKLVWHSLRDVLGYEPVAFAYSAEKPDKLRGPEHDFAWADELASWRYQAAWSNLQFGLRVGDNPRAIVTTTPKPSALIKKLYAKASSVVTGATTFDNAANLADAALLEFIEEYHGTALGRQELLAQILEEAEGALWLRKWIEDNRITCKDDEGNFVLPEFDALVIAVDPATTSKKTSNETGIIAVGRESRPVIHPETRVERIEQHFYILEDASGQLKPDVWATRAIDLRQFHDADYILGETNNGGELVEFTIQTVDDTELFESVTASRGKAPRAHPVAAAAAQGRVHHVGQFTELEDQLCNWEQGALPETPNDRLDAMVWGVSKLMAKSKRKKRVQGIQLGVASKEAYFTG